MFSRTRMPSAATALLGLVALFATPASAADIVLRFGSINAENTAAYDKVLLPFAKAVEEESGGRLDPTTGALYQALRRLTEENLVAPVAGPGDVDPRRKYFAISRLGRRAVAQEAERLAALVRAARQRGLYPHRA